MTEERLYTPGPTPLPSSVREVLARPIRHHRTAEFQTVLARCTAGLMRLFQTRQPVLTLTGSGTAGMEALVANLASPGETVAVLNAGKFGGRWLGIARAYGLKVVELARPWGASFSGDEVGAFLDGEASAATLLFVTHSETSTGALHDLEDIAAAARTRGKLVVADVVTSLGIHPVDFDTWGLGAAVAGSQKGLMLPPGLTAVTLSETAWQRVAKATLPRFYLDLPKARASLNANATPFTPAVPLVLALEESLRLLEAEGIEAVHARHARHAAACRAAAATLGLSLFPERPSHGLTALRVPEGRDGQELVKAMLDSHGMRIAGGQEPMKGKLVRLGHMGHYADQDMLDLAAALEDTVNALGWTAEAGAVAAAEAALAQTVPSAPRES